MASKYDYEYAFTFRKPKDFWVHLNKQMVIKDRDTLNDDGLYHLILFSSLPKDPNECIDSNGCLKQSATGMTKITSGYTDQTFHLGVEWIDNGENGFNLFLDEWEDNTDPTSKKVNVEIPIAEETELYVRGIMLCKVTGSDTGTDYVVAFTRESTPVRVFNYLTLMYGSSFVGHQSCNSDGDNNA